MERPARRKTEDDGPRVESTERSAAVGAEGKRGASLFRWRWDQTPEFQTDIGLKHCPDQLDKLAAPMVQRARSRVGTPRTCSASVSSMHSRCDQSAGPSKWSQGRF